MLVTFASPGQPPGRDFDDPARSHQYQSFSSWFGQTREAHSCELVAVAACHICALERTFGH